MSARRFLLGAFGDPGHAFPMIALGRGLRARGHRVTLQTWERWRSHVEAEGLDFAPAPEYQAFPVPLRDRDGELMPLDFYEAIVYATRDTQPLVSELRPDAVVSDILTLAPSLAAELHSIPTATLIPHVFPEAEDGFPIYSFGAKLPRTRIGRSLWSAAHLPVDKGLESGRIALNRTRAAVGLPPLSHVHGGTSRQLALVGSFPQLEYPRRWPAHVHVVGPLMWEPPGEQAVEPPIARSRTGATTDLPAAHRNPSTRASQDWTRASQDARLAPSSPQPPVVLVAPSSPQPPVVLVAPSTSQDPDHRLLLAALKGLADADVRVIATWNRRLPPRPLPVPPNARVVEWVSYSQTMPSCDVVVCHAGHGTVARALSSGCVVVACPVAGDMNENAARVSWTGAGVRLPRRFISPRPLRLAVERAARDEAMRARARELAAWAQSHDAAERAAVLLERLVEQSDRRDPRCASAGRSAQLTL